MPVINCSNSFKIKELYNLCKKAVDMHVKYYQQIEFSKLLTKCCEATYFWANLSVAIKFCTIFIIPSVVQYITTDHEVLLGLYVPGVDHETSPGFEFVTICHFLDNLIAVVELVLYEVQILGICINICCLGDILLYKIEILNCDNNNVDDDINEIIVIYNEYIEFVSAFNGAFNFIITLKFVTSVFNISFSLFIVQLVSFIEIYMYTQRRYGRCVYFFFT